MSVVGPVDLSHTARSDDFPQAVVPGCDVVHVSARSFALVPDAADGTVIDSAARGLVIVESSHSGLLLGRAVDAAAALGDRVDLDLYNGAAGM